MIRPLKLRGKNTFFPHGQEARGAQGTSDNAEKRNISPLL
jgi:hypothetical protein